MAQSDQTRAQPPAPPEFARRLRFAWTQIIGVSLLALLPAVALTGVLGTIERKADAHAGALALEVRFPFSMHYGSKKTLEMSVRNESKQPLRNVRVRVDDRYLSRFIDLRFTPQPSRLDDAHTEVMLGEMAGGEMRRVALQLEANQYGRPRGSISAAAEGSGEARVDISTLVLP